VLVFVAAYEVGMTWRGGGTLGKRRLKLSIVGLEGGPVSFSMAARRFLTWFVPFFVCFVACGATFPQYPWWSFMFFAGTFASLGLAAWAFRDANGRGVHDRLAETRVIGDQ
jgi:uncharacterized RDD family membrane protein YckC